MTKKDLVEIIEDCVYNSQVLMGERVCFNELRKELNEELPEQLTLTDVSQQRELLLDFWMKMPNTHKHKGVAEHYIDNYLKSNNLQLRVYETLNLKYKNYE
jgi:hypothetical protein